MRLDELQVGHTCLVGSIPGEQEMRVETGHKALIYALPGVASLVNEGRGLKPHLNAGDIGIVAGSIPGKRGMRVETLV